MGSILVAGGAGFIGAHLCRRLLAENHVICLDNLSTGDRKNLFGLLDNPRFTFIERDIVSLSDIEGPLEIIYNLACPASPKDYSEMPLTTLAACSEGTRNLLELSLRRGARLVHASTSEVYGDPMEHPQPETYWGNVNPIGPRSCYDEGKRFAESLIVNYGRERGADACVARLFNTYGPMMRAKDGRVVSTFINQALAGRDITVFGDGSRTRSFCFITDTVEALVRLMSSGEEGPINIGNPAETTIGDLAAMVIRLTGSNSRIVYKDVPEDDPQRRCPDITRARETLGWQPVVELEKGLLETISWYKALREG